MTASTIERSLRREPATNVRSILDGVERRCLRYASEE